MFVQLATALYEYDAAWFLWLNHHRIPNSVPVLQFISDTTTFTSIGLILSIFIASIIKRSKILRKSWITLAISITLVALSTQVIKSCVNRERPFKVLPSVEKLSTGGDASFPSGHTAEAFAMASAISLLFRKRWVATVITLWAIVVAYSRIALGVHYPGDVLGGALLGVFVGSLVVVILNRSNLFHEGDSNQASV